METYSPLLEWRKKKEGIHLNDLFPKGDQVVTSRASESETD